MHSGLGAICFAAVVLLSSGATAARVCGAGANSSFLTRLSALRWDSADPNNGNQLATIAASLTDSKSPLYPLYECNAEWPEAWNGWYKGGNDIIWSDCIWTGAGAGKDETVSFAVDWKNKTMYLSHTFACSDRPTSYGLATGSINLDLECKSTEGTSYCVPKTTTSGSRPVWDISTALEPAPLDATANCKDTVTEYQSWRLEKWLRQYQMPPASLAPGSTSTPLFDTGPSFALVSMANNASFNCTTSGKQNKLLEGTCESEIPASTVNFTFDPELNILTIRQHWDCGTFSTDVVGVDYMQAACDRNYNSDLFTCTSLPVWIGTETL